MDERYVDVSYDEDNGLRLVDALRAVRRHLLACLAAGFVVAGAFLAYTVTQMEPQYECSFTVCVSNRPATEETSEEETATTYYLGAGDVDASNSLATTAAFIFESSDMARSAVQHADLGSYEQRALDKELISTSIEQGTPLVTVAVTADSPQDAYQLSEALLDLIPDRMASIAGGSSVSVVESAQMPTRQSSPSNVRNAALGFLLGFGLSALVAVARSGRDKRIRDKDELEERFGVPTIVDAQDVLPLLPVHAARVVGIMDAEDGSLAAADALAIAASFSARGARTLLVDADTTGATCCRLLGASNVTGLSDVLAGERSASDVIQHLADGGLDVMAPGRRTSDFARRAGGAQMESLLASLAGAYDCVVVAIPPVLSDDSALVLADRVGKAFLSVCAGRSRKPDVAEALRRLNLADVQIVGIMYGGPRGRAGRLVPRRG